MALHQVSSRPGRPLSRRAAWAVLALAAPNDEEVVDSELVRDLRLAPSGWSRARKRLADILGAPVPEDLLRAWLRRRAERRVFRASQPGHVGGGHGAVRVAESRQEQSP